MRGPWTTRAALTAYAEAQGIDLVFFDPPEHFDAAILGIVLGFGQAPAVVYDEDLVLALMAKDLGEDGAEEWLTFNTIGAYVGEATPRFLRRVPS